ncbi:MAG: hypothetical protein M1148_04050 [Candidatus Thermoplasmatota archaeon]|nr:hypothetical protein [Candidatus Thermoplasmatota archaeon]
MQESLRKDITYFRYSGETNTIDLLNLARKRALDNKIRTVIIPSETGISALKAIQIFRKTEIQLVVVTHYPDRVAGPKGDIPIGINRLEYEDRRNKIRESGVEIVQGTRPFVPPSRIDWSWNSMEGMIDSTLELFGSGTKIAIEVALMATDAGKVDTGEEVVTCGGTYKGLDTALVVKTSHSHKFFEQFEVREIIAKPRFLVHADGQYSDPNWKGNVAQYYEARE